MRTHVRLATEAAVKAGMLIRSHVGKVRTVGFKGDINLVTDVDRKAEDLIIRHLKKYTPTIDILAEESAAEAGRSDCRWVIDPLDGTTNFAHGFPFFCVSVALEKEGVPVLGVVYDPLRGEMFRAERGRGAFLNKKRIHVSTTKVLKNALLATGFAYDFKKAERSNIESFVHFITAARAIRRAGSAALDLCYVACGRFDGFWELDLYPWDTAAGSLIVTEAGGRVSRFLGEPYSHYDKEILASNGRVHRAMAAVLEKAKKDTVCVKKILRGHS